MAPAEPTSATMTVAVAYGERTRQVVVEVSLPANATAATALDIALPALRQRFPDVDLHRLALAVWGAPATPDTPLNPNDRLELLRPLTADPKLARRSRVDANARRKPPGSVFRR